LISICDIAELIRSAPELDGERALRLAERLGCERALHLGVYLAWDLLGARLPKHIQQPGKADPRVSALAAQVRESLPSGQPISPSERYRFQRQAICPSWHERVQLAWRHTLFRAGLRWAIEPPDGPFAPLYPLLERLPSKYVWLWPLPLYALLFLASHPLYPMRQALKRALQDSE
jgi:hypothetical protein